MKSQALFHNTHTSNLYVQFANVNTQFVIQQNFQITIECFQKVNYLGYIRQLLILTNY
jgi:hypothetical protein